MLFGKWVVLKDQWLNANSLQQVGYSFELLKKCPETLATRCSFFHSFSNLGIVFAQIFQNDPLHPLTIHAQLICFHSNCKTAIALYFFFPILNILYLFCWWIASHFWDHFTHPFFSRWISCAIQKSRVLDIASSPLTSWSNLSALVGIFPRRTKKLDLLFDAHHSHQRKKKNSQKILILSSFY